MPIIASQLKPAHDPLASLRGLQEAYRNQWLLSPSELAQLLKLSPKTVRSYGARFEDAGFVFTRAGTRKRGEVAWKISKLVRRITDYGVQQKSDSKWRYDATAGRCGKYFQRQMKKVDTVKEYRRSNLLDPPRRTLQNTALVF